MIDDARLKAEVAAKSLVDVSCCGCVARRGGNRGLACFSVQQPVSRVGDVVWNLNSAIDHIPSRLPEEQNPSGGGRIQHHKTMRTNQMAAEI